MRPDIQHLLELQAVDRRLTALRSSLAAAPQQLADIEKHLSDAKQKVAAAKEAVGASAKARKTYELDVESWKEKARKYRNQGSEVKTNEAYKALQHEIQHAEEEVALAEDRLLERMVAGEEQDRQVKAAEREFAEVEKTTATARQKLESERSVLEKDLAAREAERQGAIAAIPPELLQLYERVAQRRHGVGIAEVVNGSCSQCGFLLPPHISEDLRHESTELFRCEGCTRILYYIPPPVTEAGEESKSAAGAGSDT